MYNSLSKVFQKQLTLEVLQDVVNVWNEMQKELAALSTQGKRILVKESGHNIQLDRTDVVIDAKSEVFDQVAQ